MGINIKKNQIYFLLILITLISVSFVIADYSAWLSKGKPQSHDKLFVSQIYANGENNVTLKSNINLPLGKDIKINDKSVITTLIQGNGVTITSSGIEKNKKTIAGNSLGVIGYEKVTNICSGKTLISCTASCSSGKKVIGGGCSFSQSTAYLVNDLPSSGSSGWDCKFKYSVASTQQLSAYAICITI